MVFFYVLPHVFYCYITIVKTIKIKLIKHFCQYIYTNVKESQIIKCKNTLLGL